MQNIIAVNQRYNAFRKKMDIVPRSTKKLNSIIDKVQCLSNLNFSNLSSGFNLAIFEKLQEFSNTLQNFSNDPEIQFSYITELGALSLGFTESFKESLSEDLTDEYLNEKENLIDENLLPYLERLKLDSLWLGASYALNSKSNPDKLRHCLISLRTILEYLIDELLAPNEKLSSEVMFESDFKNYLSGRISIEKVKIKRSKKIRYFTSKIKFGVLEKFTTNDINYVCNCYSLLCNVHKPDIGLSENQVRVLKIKTGITIWLLASIYEILNE